MRRLLFCVLTASMLSSPLSGNGISAIQDTENVSMEEKSKEEVATSELDLGDYQAEMVIGEKQLLVVTVLPLNATNQELEYQSSDASVATINGMGRITAVGKGETQISVTCGAVTETFLLTVTEENKETEQAIAVQDIEIADYEENLKVDAALTLNATVLPSDATDTAVTYQSSNPQIATVSSTGEVKGISPGQVIISVSAGGVTKKIPITVKIATTAITLSNNYCVMKPGETFRVSACVEPAGASNAITYKSLDTGVASVSQEGLISAKECGSTAIVVSNGELQVSVTVIVNEDGKITTKEENLLQDSEKYEEALPEIINAKDYPVLTSNMLKYLYQNKKSITIKGQDYTIYLKGEDIVNIENELITELVFQKTNQGITFCVNDNQKLCGKIAIDVSQELTHEKYLYLYNEEKKIYQMLSVPDVKRLDIDTEGTYLITQKKISGLQIKKSLVGGGCILLLLAGTYIGVKKQYWFW
ncbi:MAG: Ig-like domain-containing protein [Roseburia sp.]|nr:Ig-like domain-containing protein [Roseburia sp.]MDY5883600.1 Ig-like domain-containing protein [Roseburia sp.]